MAGRTEMLKQERFVHGLFVFPALCTVCERCCIIMSVLTSMAMDDTLAIMIPPHALQLLYHLSIFLHAFKNQSLSPASCDHL